jgi:predicted nucleic acid-binding protein
MARKPKIYLDTSVLGALYDREDPVRVEKVGALLQRIEHNEYDAFISLLTLEELMRAPEDIKNELVSTIKNLDLAVLEENEESLEFAEFFVTEGIIPKRFRDDARHIAVAILHNLDALVSWNYRHMVNIRTRKMVNSLCVRQGYKPIDIVSPEEVIEYE